MENTVQSSEGCRRTVLIAAPVMVLTWVLMTGVYRRWGSAGQAVALAGIMGAALIAVVFILIRRRD